MVLESIMLTEISLTRTVTIKSLMYMESKTKPKQAYTFREHISCKKKKKQGWGLGDGGELSCFF